MSPRGEKSQTTNNCQQPALQGTALKSCTLTWALMWQCICWYKPQDTKGRVLTSNLVRSARLQGSSRSRTGRLTLFTANLGWGKCSLAHWVVLLQLQGCRHLESVVIEKLAGNSCLWAGSGILGLWLAICGVMVILLCGCCLFCVNFWILPAASTSGS